MEKTNPSTVYCAFCGKNNHDVEQMFGADSTGRLCICNECVELAMGTLKERRRNRVDQLDDIRRNGT